MIPNRNKPTETSDEMTLEQTLVFRSGQELFGISLGTVLEVFQSSSAPSPVPGAPPWLEGILHHQGEVLPVVRARTLFEGEMEPGQDSPAQLILIDLGVEKIFLHVDAIVALESIQSSGPLMQDGNRRAWLKGRLLTILDPGNLNNWIKKMSTN